MRTKLLLTIPLLVFTSTAFAQTAAPSQGAAAKPAPAVQLVSGEVRKVDKDARKITLRHGEIKQLDMPRDDNGVSSKGRRPCLTRSRRVTR